MSCIVVEDKKKHNVCKYQFKNFEIDENDDVTHIYTEQNNNIDNNTEDNVLNNSENSINLDQSKQELLDKLELLNGGLDEVKSEIISHKESIKSHFEVESKQSYDSGYLAGKNEVLQEMSKKDQEIKSRLIEAISAFENERKKIDSSILVIENELIKASLDIASEVIKTEISKNHQQIAVNLAKELIKEVKKATAITIKVNTNDYDLVSKAITDNNIKVEADRALAPGGIMILSDIGNIDGTIKERFMKIKSLIYK